MTLMQEYLSIPKYLALISNGLIQKVKETLIKFFLTIMYKKDAAVG